MIDAMRFTSDKLDMKQGKTVRLCICKADKIPHELVLGTPAETVKHAKMMRKSPEMEHADTSSARVATGGTGEIVWQFDKALNFPCTSLIPVQGMVSVAPDQAATTSNAHVMPVAKTTALAASDDHYTSGEKSSRSYRAGQARHQARWNR